MTAVGRRSRAEAEADGRPGRTAGAATGASATVRLGAESVAYTLLRRRRRSIGFVVRPDGLTVHAPTSLGIAAIEAALHVKAGWILAKLAAQRERARRAAAERVEWREGCSLRYLGAPVAIRLDPSLRRAVLEHGEGDDGPAPARLRLPLPTDAAPDRIEAAANVWLRAEAARVFAERCVHHAPRIGVAPSRLRISTARTRWGSASADGSIRLNLRLIHLPLAQLDYVVVHELAHLREMNHGPRFWRIVDAVLPEHLALRRALRQAEPGVLD